MLKAVSNNNGAIEALAEKFEQEKALTRDKLRTLEKKVEELERHPGRVDHV